MKKKTINTVSVDEICSQVSDKTNVSLDEVKKIVNAFKKMFLDKFKMN